MRLLFDQNLAERLVSALSNEFPGSSHVKPLGLAGADDVQIWEFARTQGFVIATKDSDFNQLSLLYGPPPKVIWLRCGNSSTRDIEDLMRSRLAQIALFGLSEEDAVLMIA